MSIRTYFDIPEIKASANIHEVWSALGGGALRRGRGRAFWREGADGDNVSVDARRGLWHDFASGQGGDVISLIETVRQCDFRGATEWLADYLGVQVSPTSTRRDPVADRAWATDLRWALWWRISAIAFTETTLESLSQCAPERRGLTEFLASIQLGDASLVDEYHQWRHRCPRLTHAMARAGQSSDARQQRRLAHWIVENGRGRS